MDSDPSLSPAVAGRDFAIGVSGKSSTDGAVVGVESLPEDPSVPVAATEDKITVSTAVARRSNGEPHRPNPWLNHDDPTAEINSSSSLSWSDPDPDSPVDAYSGDHFRMFEFKVRPCARVRSHDWTECPYAHPGEKARRRDPRKFHYSGSVCPDFRKGHCKKGDSCEFAHGVFECWLHPARYRTQPCKDGTSCERRVCFYAHTPEQLRVLPQQSPRGSNSVNSSMGDTLVLHTVPVAATEDKITVSTAVAGDGPNVGSGPSGCGLHVGVGAGISSDGSNGHSSTDSAVIESDYPDLQPQDTNLVLETGNLERGTGFESPVYSPRLRLFGFAMGDTPRHLLVPNSMGGTTVSHNVEGGNMRAGVDSASLISRGMGVTVFQTGNVEGALISLRRMLAGIGLASPISMGDTLVIQTGDVEAGHLLTGIRFGVGRSDITPMNDDFRMYIVNSEPQTGNYPPPLEISGDNSHLVRPLEQHLRSNCFVILFVTSEILGMVFEIIYQESHIMAYFFIWIVCVTIAMYAARLLAMIEGGMANREQFAVYLRCFSFLLLELLQYWGIHQGNYVTALKIILRVTGAIIGWWVVGVLPSYMDAFGRVVEAANFPFHMHGGAFVNYDGEAGSRK
ncbi:hypothetical protein ACLB2K_008980 [Fragaria x ananassa]